MTRRKAAPKEFTGSYHNRLKRHNWLNCNRKSPPEWFYSRPMRLKSNMSVASIALCCRAITLHPSPKQAAARRQGNLRQTGGACPSRGLRKRKQRIGGLDDVSARIAALYGSIVANKLISGRSALVIIDPRRRSHSAENDVNFQLSAMMNREPIGDFLILCFLKNGECRALEETPVAIGL